MTAEEGIGLLRIVEAERRTISPAFELYLFVFVLLLLLLLLIVSVMPPRRRTTDALCGRGRRLFLVVPIIAVVVAALFLPRAMLCSIRHGTVLPL